MRRILLAAVIGILTASYVNAADFTLLPMGSCAKCDRAYARCKRENCPTPGPTGSPDPTRSPKPTGSPIACESIGGTKDYTAGDEKLLCFDAGAQRPLMEVSVKGQPSYAGELAVQLQAPSGARYNALASQPNTVLPWEPGKWYLWSKLAWGEPTHFVFTPR